MAYKKMPSAKKILLDVQKKTGCQKGGMRLTAHVFDFLSSTTAALVGPGPREADATGLVVRELNYPAKTRGCHPCCGQPGCGLGVSCFGSTPALRRPLSMLRQKPARLVLHEHRLSPCDETAPADARRASRRRRPCTVTATAGAHRSKSCRSPCTLTAAADARNQRAVAVLAPRPHSLMRAN